MSTSNKIRGFEFVSKEQMIRDIGNIEDIYIQIPKRGTRGSAGYDIFSPFDIYLKPNEELKIPTGIKAYMQQGEVLIALPRSGLGYKYYSRLANTVGVIDSDYYYSDNEGHIWMKIRNEGNIDLEIKKGEAFCQVIFMPFLLVDGDNFTEGRIRNGGFGSTNK